MSTTASCSSVSLPNSVTVSPTNCTIKEDMIHVANYLGHWFEVHLIDGRIVRGLLVATDKEPNFILRHAMERWTLTEEPRFIGLAMIAKRHVKQIFQISDEVPTTLTPSDDSTTELKVD
ncbi:hypothetical protein WR25_16107 [Diploscapter pachys]|uniref:Sm domain-containing protein n=1 Tax=Diploscapter pachys TaxID=2018661 RepID=A0A2A2LAZ3_9BILA|nr:hypothetical protein WR25_16107 [Diploscapter pachys]